MGNRFKREIDISSLERIKEQCVVNENGCWVWQHAKTIFGYGSVGFNKKVVLVHRYVYGMSKGKIPKGIFVRHSCDNPACCNPEHLLVGTQKDNIQDAIRRGRISCGEKHSRAVRLAVEKGRNYSHPKISKAQATEIRTLRKSGMLVKDIAKKFSVSETMISLVSRNKRLSVSKHWSEVTPMDLNQSIIEAAYKYVNIIDRIGRGEVNLNYERTEAHDEFITLLQHAHITGIGFDWDGRGNARELAERIVTWIRE